MKLTKDDRKHLHAILSQAFPSSADLDAMTQLYLEVPIAHISAAGPVPHMVLHLIQWAEARGRILELVEAAREANPSNPELKALANQLLAAAPAVLPATTVGLSAAVEKAEFSTSKELEARERTTSKATPPVITTEVLQRIALKSIAFANTEEWRAQMVAREGAVCRVEFPCESGQGTGFLIGPDLVMTNYHVLEPHITGSRPASEVCCRFGFKTAAEHLPPANGEAFPLADRWLVASSPVNELDYAIARLRNAATTQGAGRVPLAPAKHDFEVGEALFLLQHPKAAPLKLASGGLVKAEATRIFYLANSLRGSSGSPCFTANWELVGLHRAGDDLANVGVPFTAIVTDLKAKGTVVFS